VEEADVVAEVVGEADEVTEVVEEADAVEEVDGEEYVVVTEAVVEADSVAEVVDEAVVVLVDPPWFGRVSETDSQYATFCPTPESGVPSDWANIM